MRDHDEVGPKPEPRVAPEEPVASRLETLPEDVDALAPPLPPLAFEELQTANTETPTKWIFSTLCIVIVILGPE